MQGGEMDFYHWWIYKNIFNATWFIWTIVIIVFAFNLLGPILIWFRINSRPLPFMKKKQKDGKQQNNG
jgi:small-conductance mechanosensitive channel